MKILSFIIIAISLSACVSTGTHYEVAVKADKHKLEVIKNASAENSSTIYLPEKLYFTHVDKKRLFGVKYVGLGLSGFPTALTLTAGSHEFNLWKNGSPHFDLHIKDFNMQAGNDYFINYIVKTEKGDEKLFYWIENIKTGDVVQGRKRTLGELNELNTKPSK